MNNVCWGNCKEHIGEIREVTVFSADWGKEKYFYCEAAIEYDRRNGFTVELEQPIKEDVKEDVVIEVVDTYPFFHIESGWYYCYKDMNGLNQHSQIFKLYDDALRDYSELRSQRESSINIVEEGKLSHDLINILYECNCNAAGYDKIIDYLKQYNISHK